MAHPALDTPRTDVGNATHLTNGTDLDFSMENSFHSPSKDNNDLIRQIRGNNKGLNLKTPRSRAPFGDRRNGQTASQGEFTPLLKSVTKSNLLRRHSGMNGSRTPSFARPGQQSILESPALPVESSGIYEENTGSSFGGDDDGTPVPQVASSSAMSTPLASLPQRDGGGVITDGANVMTLREQENIINKIEKENFGLKLKIHFLEEALRKAGPGFSEAALKENTELKVDKVTLQKELRQYRKTLSLAERELETYRQQLAELQEKAKRRHADEDQREHMENLQKELEEREVELEEMREKVEMVEERDQSIEKLKDEIGDLEHELRDKERAIEEKEDELDAAKEKIDAEMNTAAELEEELEVAKKRVQELEELQANGTADAEELEEAKNEINELSDKIEGLEADLNRLRSDLEEAQEERDEALDFQRRAESDLDELRQEMADKSFSTKGLSRQLEEKANKLEQELETLRKEHVELQEEHDTKVRETEKLHETVEVLKQDIEIKEQKLRDELEMVRHQHDITLREQKSLKSRLEEVSTDLRHKVEEKDLLQTRHDALTSESEHLQRDLAKAQSNSRELEDLLENERRHAADNELALRGEVQENIADLNAEVDDLRRHAQSLEQQIESERENWSTERRSLAMERDKAEEQATGLKRTIDKLQELEGTTSNRELKVREALESERQRHEQEEQILRRQIQELNDEVASKKGTLEATRSEIIETKEELRISNRNEDILKEKMQGLEDEIEILATSLEEETERTKEEVAAARQETDALRRQLQTAKQDLIRSETARSSAEADLENFRGDLEVEEGSKDHLGQRLHELQEQLQAVRREKQALQDQVATINIELHSMRASTADIEAERDELKSQMKLMQDQVDETFRLDQEKIELRKTNLKLEMDLTRIKEEKKALLQKNIEIERQLEAEIGKALMDTPAADLSLFRHDLAAARKKESEYAQNESSYKTTIHGLKSRIAELEQRLHAMEISKLAVDSPKSSVSGSARKTEVIEVRRQLAEAHQQIKETRMQARESERAAQRKLVTVENDYQLKVTELEDARYMLEQEIADTRLQQEQQQNKNASAEQTIGKLRTKIQHLEKELHEARLRGEDKTITEERKDLHDMLKDAKLEVEDMQLQVKERDSRIDSLVAKEKDIRSQLKRVREERSVQARKANAVSRELDTLQGRHERTVEKLAKLQEGWEQERKAMNHRVRFPNTSVSSIRNDQGKELRQMEVEVQEKERRHQGELRGLAKQIQYLRAKCLREEGFRADLAYSKKFFLLQIEMYNACNRADLSMLEEMGITPDQSIREKKPTLKSVGYMVMAAMRMKRLQKEWDSKKKIRDTLARKLEQVKRHSGKGVV